MAKSKLFKDLDVEIVGGKKLTIEDAVLISAFIKKDKAKRRQRSPRASKKESKSILD